MTEIRPFDRSAAGLEEIASLLRLRFPGAGHLSPAYLGWDYDHNPAGAAIGYNAYADGHLVAHFASRPMRARIGNRDELGLLTQHAATRADYAGKGLFTQLVERTMETGADAGFGFAVAVANANTTHPFVNKLDFQYVRPLEVKIGIAPAPRSRADDDLQFATTWDERSIAWRLARPDRPYRATSRGDRCVVFAPSEMLGIFVEVAEFPRELVPDSIPELSTRNPLRAWVGLDPSRDWSRTAYLEVPVKLRPAPLNLTFRDLTGRGRTLDGDRVRIQAVDFDAF